MDETAKLLAGGKYDACEAGHGEHLTLPVEVRAGGAALHLDVFDWRTYEGTVGYCSGDDEVSRSIEVNGLWEPIETDLVAGLVDSGDVVVDFGCHVGWFSCLAAREGASVLAVDADTEHLRVLKENARLNSKRPGLITPVRGWIGEDSLDLPLPPSRIRFVKMDLEGNEDQAIRIIAPLLDLGIIDFVLMEVSPIFRPHYPETLHRVFSAGYSCAVLETDAPTPLAARDVEPFLDSIDQANVLFRYEGARP